MKNKQNKQDDELQVPALTQIMLTPERTVYLQCSPFTQSNFTTFSKLLLFTVPVCGFILGASLSKFCFEGNTASYFLTVPLATLTYWFMDRLIIMADSRENPKFIKNSRYVIAFVFGMFNSFLIDSSFYKSDINAEIQKEITIEQNTVQAQTDSLDNIHQAHKERLLSQIRIGEGLLKERSNQLVAEVEGSSYSHHVGRGQVYEEKRAVFDRESADFAHEKALLLNEASKDDSAIAQIDREGAKKIVHVPEHISHGFNHNMELLHIVIFRKPFNIFVACLFLFISMILELLPLLAKQYIDISEYFEHAMHHIDAHLATAAMRKEQMIEQQEHSFGLANHRLLQAERGRHAVEIFRQKSLHNERVLDAVDNHFEQLTQKQIDMETRYPKLFNKHISSLFDRLYNMFRDNQVAATNLNSEEEKLKIK